MPELDPHRLVGGHQPVDVDPFLPTGRCAVCEGVALDERLPEDRGPDNPYDPGVPAEEIPEEDSEPEPHLD